MPWREKARVMVQRGEAKDFSDAARQLRSRRKPVTKPQPTPPTRHLWYANEEN
jgi:hypothetical protein